MRPLRAFTQTMKLFAGCTVFATMLLSLGCAEMQTFIGMNTHKHPRYPTLVVTEPAFENNGKTGDVPVNLGVIGKSDSELWKDITDLADEAKHWRVQVFKFSDNSYVGGFEWVERNTKTQRLEKIPLEVMMRGYVDFCYDDDPNNPKPQKDQQSRGYLFLLHHFPEESDSGMMAPKKE